MPRCLLRNYFWVCSWGWLLKTWASESGRLSGVPCPSLCRWASSNLLKAWTEQKGEERGNRLHSLLPICLLLHSDWNLYHWLPWFLGLWTQTSYTTCFAGSPACSWQIVGIRSIIMSGKSLCVCVCIYIHMRFSYSYRKYCNT